MIRPAKKSRWSSKVPHKPGLYWTAILVDGVQHTTLRQISIRPDREQDGRSGVYLTPGIVYGREPIEIAEQETRVRRKNKEGVRMWLPAEVPMMPGAKEIEA